MLKSNLSNLANLANIIIYHHSSLS